MDEYLIALLILLFITVVALIILKTLNYRTKKRTEEINKQIPPFEVIVKKDEERLVLTENLEDGDILNRPIFNEKNRMLYEKGFVITEQIKKKLLAENIKLVYVDMKKNLKEKFK